MNINKYTKCLCTVILLGQFTSTAAAQTINPENVEITDIQLSKLKTIDSLNKFKLRNSQLRTLKEANFKSEIIHPELSLPNIDTQVTAQNPEVQPERDIYITPRIGAQFTSGAGVGYESSYTTVEGFVPLVQNPGKDLTFIQGKLHLATTNDDSQLRLIIDSNPINNSSNNFAVNSFNTADIFAAVRSNNITGATNDFEVITFDNSNICLQTRNNQISNFNIEDLFGGIIQIEEGFFISNIIPQNTGSRLSATTVPAGTCGF